MKKQRLNRLPSTQAVLDQLTRSPNFKHYCQLSLSLVAHIEHQGGMPLSHPENCLRLAYGFLSHPDNKALAQTIGITNDRDRAWAALAISHHDIGKVSLPVELLHKTGQLTTAERRVIYSHCDSGLAMIQTMSCLANLQWFEQSAQYHHERHDGSGYQGLIGSAIPPISRLCTLIDVYDTMTSRIAYRSHEHETEAALNYLTEQSDRLVDGEWTEAFAHYIRG